MFQEMLKVPSARFSLLMSEGSHPCIKELQKFGDRYLLG